MIKLNTSSYVYGQNDTIEVGEEYIVDFEILESAEDILQTRVKVTGIN
uniref:Uncharacterized protein n=1 Tax=Siphoviridae sp. ctAsH36 TaxID=2827799 RepID=A0A8S5T9B0_9CAUD|nr:MAG TPA: hypothetical protein [Siphoviridae sp. ctAsH36]